MDGSGWTPAALRLLMKLASSAAFEEALGLLWEFGLLAPISRAGLARLTEPYAEACREEVLERLA